MAPTEEGSMASIVSVSSAAPLTDWPCPLAIADSIEAFESAPRLALAIAAAKRGFKLGSGPPTGTCQ